MPGSNLPGQAVIAYLCNDPAGLLQVTAAPDFDAESEAWTRPVFSSLQLKHLLKLIQKELWVVIWYMMICGKFYVMSYNPSNQLDPLLHSYFWVPFGVVGLELNVQKNKDSFPSL